MHTYALSPSGSCNNLKNLVFWAKSKIGIFACFFCEKPTVLAVLAGSAGQQKKKVCIRQ
jgi:hypothetical protein